VVIMIMTMTMIKIIIKVIIYNNKSIIKTVKTKENTNTKTQP